jgi:hypothetical protein
LVEGVRIACLEGIGLPVVLWEVPTVVSEKLLCHFNTFKSKIKQTKLS